MRFPATPGWDAGCGTPPLLPVFCRLRWWWWVVSWGSGGGFEVSGVVCVCGAGCFVWSSCFGVFCVFVVPVFVVVWVLWCGYVFRVRWCFCVCGVSVVFGCLSPPLSVGAGGWCLCRCGWCVLWVVPRHSWLRVLGAVRRHSWLGSAGCAGCGYSVASSWLRDLVAVRHHSWLGSGAGGCGWWSLATPD